MKKLSVLFSLLLLFTGYIWGQTLLDQSVQTKVLNSVFEVVVDKIEDKNITYERKLPLERLPYAIRNDKYIPIGTAFLLDDGNFYSASHVFQLYGDSVYKNYYIRDVKGRTFQIDKILSLSNTRDYISFTVPNYVKQPDSGLSLSLQTDLTSQVFSVGNAQGEGIIIRNGVITSQTPESQNGEWNWIRFTAAASPGNSGGPLINSDGSVIGIITMKNETENLNYALPIQEIYKKENNKGYIQFKYYYRVPNLLNYREYWESDYFIDLPKSYSDLHDELTVEYKNCINKTLVRIRAEYNPDAPKGFLKSKEYKNFNFYSFFPDTPMTIYQNSSGVWDYGYAESETFELEDNGSIEYTSILNYYVFTITKPDSLKLEDLISDPKTYMDSIVKLLNLYRSVANENVQISSLGDPCKSEKYKDYFGRTWLVNYYSVDFADSMILTYSLPLPSGMYVIYKLASRSSITSSHYLDMAFMADHTYTNYFGYVSQWREYLSLPELITSERADFEKEYSMKIDDTTNTLSFTTNDIQMNLKKEYFPYDEETRINVQNAYTIGKSKGEIENRGIAVYTKPKTKDYKYVLIQKYVKPIKDTSKKITQMWSQFLSKIPPFNNEPYSNENYTFLNTCVNSNNSDSPDYLYIYGFELLNQNQNEQIIELSQNVMKDCKSK